MNNFRKLNAGLPVLFFAILLAGCGGGDSGSDINTDTDTDNAPVNNAPVADAGVDQSVNEGVSVNLDGSASSDSDGDTLSYVWTQTSGPIVTLAGASSATATFTAPDTTADVSLVFELTVSDLDGATSTDGVTVTVNAVANQAPMAKGDPGFGIAGEAYSFTPEISDSDGDALTLSATNLPAWLSFNSATGELSGTPTASDIATYADVTITVSDGELSADLIFDIEVIEDALEAALKSGDHRYVTNEQTYLTAIIETIEAGLLDDSLPAEAADVLALFERFESDSFSFDLRECPQTGCESGSAYHTEFLYTAVSLKRLFDGLDAAPIDIFKSPDAYRYEKLLVLIADYYRSNVVFDIYVGSRNKFLKSMYADHVVYNHREINPAQPDLGTFSRSDFSHITPENVSVTMTSRGDFRAAGVYALPGETVRVTRNDAGAVATALGVNTIRHLSLKEFERTITSNGYNRPKYLTSTWIPIAAGETIYFTSPYGGPVQVQFDTNDIEVSLTFENVGRHPYWDGPEDDADFVAALAADDYDWGEFVTPHFEVHSTHMASSLNNINVDSPSALYEGITNFFIRHPYTLAGYSGEGIDVIPAIHDWAAANGLAIMPMDYVQHVNADVASCSTACGGNPYDTDAEYLPYALTTHMHELGHSIEMRRRPTGWNGHTQTDLYYHYAVSRARIEDASSPGAKYCYKNFTSHQALFEMLQESRNQADPFAYVQAQNLEAEWRNGLSIMMQMMALAQHQGVVDDGWYMLSRLQVISREFDIAQANDTDWAAKAAGMGFDGMTRADAGALNNDDWWLIALSHIMQLNMTNYLEMWGMDLSATAKTHMAGLGLMDAPLLFYALDMEAQCNRLDATALLVDGVTAWP